VIELPCSCLAGAVAPFETFSNKDIVSLYSLSFCVLVLLRGDSQHIAFSSVTFCSVLFFFLFRLKTFFFPESVLYFYLFHYFNFLFLFQFCVS
jgi:hypothetical protein